MSFFPFDLTSDAVPCPLRYQAERQPDALALVGPNVRLTYGEMERWVAGTAAALRDEGVGQGTRVAWRLRTGPEAVMLLFALQRLGAVACPLSTRLPERGVREALHLLQSPFLLTDERELMALDLRTLAPARVVRPGKGEGAEIDPGRPATVVFTSGSTGQPKAAVHAFGRHAYSALGARTNLPLGEGDRWLLSLPLYHVGGLAILFRCFLSGATVVLPGPDRTLGPTLGAFEVTHVSLVATQLRRLLREENDLPALKGILLGGGPTPAPLLAEAVARGLPVLNSYGLTEMASQVTATPPGAPLAQRQTAGRVLPYRELRIEEDGEILVRGETLFEGYLGPRGIVPAVDGEGWYATGDLGRWDEDRNLVVLGRRDNMFVSGGENIHPEVIEQALARIPGILQALVVPVPDAEFGARPVAFVEAEPGTEPAAWREVLEAELPRFMLPRAFFPWPSDEERVGFKVARAGLRRRAERLWQERGGRE